MRVASLEYSLGDSASQKQKREKTRCVFSRRLNSKFDRHSPIDSYCRLRCSLLLKPRFRLLRQLAEGSRVVHGNVGEYLAVDFDSSLVQTVHKSAVRHVALAGSGVYTRDP